MSLVPLVLQSMPSHGFFSSICRVLIAASDSMPDKPEFSASAIGMVSSASAKARIANCPAPTAIHDAVVAHQVAHDAKRVMDRPLDHCGACRDESVKLNHARDRDHDQRAMRSKQYSPRAYARA